MPAACPGRVYEAAPEFQASRRGHQHAAPRDPGTDRARSPAGPGGAWRRGTRIRLFQPARPSHLRRALRPVRRLRISAFLDPPRRSAQGPGGRGREPAGTGRGASRSSLYRRRAGHVGRQGLVRGRRARDRRHRRRRGRISFHDPTPAASFGRRAAFRRDQYVAGSDAEEAVPHRRERYPGSAPWRAARW